MVTSACFLSGGFYIYEAEDILVVEEDEDCP
jgi:hypothetical protein